MFPLTCNAIGDIVTLASLVFDIIRALNETRGSVLEYRVLAGELNAMHTMLTAVDRVVRDTADETLRYEILKEVDRCGQDVQNALARIIKFSALGHAGTPVHSPRIKLARQWYKLEWRFLQRGAFQAVRAEMQTATQRLTALLVISNADGAARFRMSLSAQFRALAERDAAQFRAIARMTEMLSEVKDAARHDLDRDFVNELFMSAPSDVDRKTVAVAVLCVAVCAGHMSDHTVQTALLLVAICILLRPGERKGNALVRDVLYTERNAVTLFDALGRRFVLPIELCRSYELLHATLTSLFSRTNGRWFVETHAYDIMDLQTATVASPNNWSTVVRIGAKIEMPNVREQEQSRDVM
ncbi:hypothetical protein PENSPDRAFT_204093 [Peniophora sp. CONT]|nr:hypothetical protein PENSPDRAFT_204093 [Peniophora sp. CONT]